MWRKKFPIHAAACQVTKTSLEQVLQSMEASTDETATINDLDSEGWSPLHRAAWNGLGNSVKTLLNHGAILSVRTGEGRKTTPLHYAAGMGHLECVNILCDSGANPALLDAEGWTPLVVAKQTATDVMFQNQAGLVDPATWNSIYRLLESVGKSEKSGTTSTTVPIFFDPHFHIWNLQLEPPIHDASVLFPPNKNPNYTLQRYESEFQEDNDSIVPCCQHVGGVFIEAMSVCYPDMESNSLNVLCVQEAIWSVAAIRRATKLGGTPSKKYSVVASACLEAENAAETLSKLVELQEIGATSVVGIRQILNKNPSWPRNKERDDFLTSPKWQQGYRLLANYNLSFDLQLNPSQFSAAVQFFSQHPKTTVIINHMGCLLEKDVGNEEVWEGLEQLASLPHVCIKISMLCYTYKDWDVKGKGREVVFNSVRRVVELFGVDRCMFASNFPVDVKDGWSAQRLLSTFVQLVESNGWNEEEAAKLFSRNAIRLYKAVKAE